jgi:hypothetical protein
VILVDKRADAKQRDALIQFAQKNLECLQARIVDVQPVAIDMTIDHVDMVGTLNAGNLASLTTRQVHEGDCVCRNEEIFYPPLTGVDNYAPAVVVEGGYTGKGLSGRWTSVNSRSAFLATFAE